MAPQASGARFDRPIFTTDGTALCPRQHHVAALRRALDDNERAAFDRAAREGGCKVVGPDIRLAVVEPPGSYDVDVDVRVAGDAPSGEPGLPRGRVWTLKSMVRNQPNGETRAEPPRRDRGDIDGRRTSRQQLRLRRREQRPHGRHEVAYPTLIRAKWRASGSRRA